VQGLTHTSAVLAATVNPHGQPTSFHFEWGRTRRYGSIAPRGGGFAGAGTANRVVTASLRGLRAGTTYHYRIVASYCGGCAVGTAAGTDGTFTTPQFPPLPGSMTWSFVDGQFSTRVRALTAHLPRGADRIQILCSAHGCPAKRWTVASKIVRKHCVRRRCTRRVRRFSNVELSARLRSHALAAGGRLTVQLFESGYTGIEFQFAFRRSQDPAFSKRCLPAGRGPVVC
jgi:hypothetical protein